jgi:hypothetical protein
VLDMSHNGLDGAIVLDTGLGVLLQSCIRLESKQLESMITESCVPPVEGAIPDCPHVVADGYGIAQCRSWAWVHAFRLQALPSSLPQPQAAER